mgnify:FL=1
MIAVLFIVAGNISAMQEEYRVELGGGEIQPTARERKAQKQRTQRLSEAFWQRRERLKRYVDEGQENIPTSQAAWLAHQIADEHLLSKYAYRFAKKARRLEQEEAGGRPLNLRPEELFPAPLARELFPGSDDSDSDN